MQDEHSMENKITAKEFFTRFPTLHGFLLEQLKTAANALEAQESRYVICYLAGKADCFISPSILCPLERLHSPKL